MTGLQLPADVDVFGQHVRAPIVDVVQCRLAECAHDTRNSEDASISALCALDQADDRRKFSHLDFPEQRGAVPDARIARDGPDSRPLNKMLYKPADCVLVEQRIAVYAN